MASTRYGIIEHANCGHECEIRFGSPQARDAFAEKFQTYHASHEHDGEAPTFKNAAASDINMYSVGDATEVTVDGWKRHHIRDYHADTNRTYVDYEPPTCCVPPLLSFDSFGDTFMPSDEFQRHELSAIFGDMPDTDYTSLLESVERDGFIENVIKLLDGEILDGWHRYRAAKELNLLRKLRFQVWNPDEDRDGDPKAFVLARNIERRHLGASQRGQIAVAFNERFGHGGDRSNASNGVLKTKKELAEQANVGTSTIDRAIAVEKAGQSEAVIAGEKTASEVITEVTLESLWEQVNAAIPAWKKKREGVGYASKTMLIHATLKFHSLPHDFKVNIDVLKKLLHLLSASTTDILEIFVRKQLRGESLWKTDDTAVDPEKLPLQDAIEEMKADESEVNPEKSESTVEDDSPKDRDSLLEEWRQARASVKDLWENDKEISQTIRYLDHFQERILVYYPAWIHPEIWKPGVDLIRNKEDGTIIAEIKQLKQIVSDIQSRADWVKEMMLVPDSDASDPDRVDALEQFRNQKHELYERINRTPLIEVKDEFGNANADKALHGVMLAAHKAYDLSEDLLRSDQAIEELSADEIRKITGKYFLMVQDFAAPRADWVASLYQKAYETEEEEVTAQPKEQADAQTTDSENSEYRLESITLGYQKKGQDISDGMSTMSFQVIASRQLGEYPMLELPESLRHEILKLIEEKA